MFKTKKQSLISKVKSDSKKGSNAFLNAANKKAAVTFSGNGAVKFATTGNDFVDQFGKCSNYKAPRTYDEVSKDMSTLWAIDEQKAFAFALYLRLITRTISLVNGAKTSTVQRGQGLKHEGIMRMIWIAVNHPNVFWKNAHLIVAVGSWKDIIMMLSYDLQYNGWDDRKLNWKQFGDMILAGLENPAQSNLLKKYLPQIKANSKCNTIEAQADNIIAKWICSLLFGSKESSYNYKKYRTLKTSGSAHEWQKLISSKNLVNINFSTIHGRALSLLVSSKFLKNNKLEEKYDKWLATQPLVKYTGFVYELTSKISGIKKKYEEDTINKQFMSLVETAKKGANKETSLIVVRDTSGSMSSPATGTKISCGDVAKSLALFFSYMLPDGAFANSWIEFHSTAQMRTWKGKTPVERWRNDHSSYVGGTNFQGVISLLCQIKKQGVAESEFPTGILCISDSEFNPTQLGKTNVETAREALKKAGFSKEYVKNFQIILWNLGNSYYGRNNSGNKFETFGETENVFYFSGLDGSVIAFLTGVEGQKQGVPKTDVELFNAAMNQEILNMIQI
jgi:hypothetical protein